MQSQQVGVPRLNVGRGGVSTECQQAARLATGSHHDWTSRAVLIAASHDVVLAPAADLRLAAISGRATRNQLKLTAKRHARSAVRACPRMSPCRAWLNDILDTRRPNFPAQSAGRSQHYPSLIDRTLHFRFRLVLRAAPARRSCCPSWEGCGPRSCCTHLPPQERRLIIL